MEPLEKRPSRGLRKRRPQCALPYDRHSPTAVQQLLPGPSVAFDIGSELGLPELLPGIRIGRVGTTGMAMPETAVDEAGRVEARECKIRCAGELSNVETVSQTAGVKRATQGEFGFRVFGGDTRHDARSGGLIHCVRHRGRQMRASGPNKRGFWLSLRPRS